MIEIQGLWWPDDVGQKWQHSLDHVSSLDYGLRYCTTRRTAVQAGGNVGLWPRKLAETFARVYTFEPDLISLECLLRNIRAEHLDRVHLSACALGAERGHCTIKHKSLGSHRVVEGKGDVQIIPIDSLNLYDVDFLQLDIEGYEYQALRGARDTIERSHPIIQVELRGFTEHYGQTDEDVRTLLSGLGYRQVRTAPGSDFIFRWNGHQ